MSVRPARSIALRFLAVLLIVALSSLFAASCTTKKETPKPKMKADTRKQLQSVINKQMQNFGTVGIVAGVWSPKGNWTTTAGNADETLGTPSKLNEQFHIDGITKTFTSTIILQLVDEGKLKLDDKLSKWFPKIPNAKNITIRQMLNMTSGIYSYTEYTGFSMVVLNSPETKWDEKMVTDIVLQHQPYNEPGKAWHFSDTNYYLLGEIIKKVSKKSLEEEFKICILDRIEFADTVFPTVPEQVGDYAHGYTFINAGRVDISGIDPSAYAAAGAVISNLDDLKTWSKALANGDIVSKKMHAEQLKTVPIPGQEKLNSKHGLGIISLDGYLGFSGTMPGYDSAMFYLPKEDTTIVVLVNKSTAEANEAFNTFISLAKIVTPDRFK